MPTLSCEACGTKVRVPERAARLKVTCPNCDAVWFYPAAREVSQLSVRCGKTGARAIVTFHRTRPDQRFVIAEIEKVSRLQDTKAGLFEPTGDGPWKIGNDPGASNTYGEGLDEGKRRSLFRTGVKMLAERFGLVARPVEKPPNEERARPKLRELHTPRRRADFNFAGYACPYCGASPRRTAWA